MRKSSSGRHRAGSEASSRPERPRYDDQDPPKGRSPADAMTSSSSRRKSSRHSHYEEPDATYATTITDEPSQIPDRYRNDSRKEPESSDPRKRSSKTDKRTKYEKSRGDKEDDESWKPRKEESPRVSRKSSKSNGKESARVYQDNNASLPQNQFPGEFPSTYSKPYRPPGLASEYYGDNGESVASQPGVRPNAPNIVTSAEQAHLLEPTIEAKPPPEPSSMGHVGAAASYFGNPNHDDDFALHTTPSKPPKPNLGSDKPPKHSYYGVSPRTSPVPQGHHTQSSGFAPGPVVPFPASGAAAIGAAAEYYAGGSGIGESSAPAYHTPNRPPASQTVPTPYSAPAGIGGSSQHSNAALYGGAAALAGAAAGAYFSGHSHDPHSLGQHQTSTNMAGAAHGHPLSQGTQTHHAHRHKHQGLFGRFVDWWRDPEAVARFEEYTEAIGVCKYCFDPMSSPADAPRRHDYRRRRPSPGSRYGSTTRVDKIYRHSSDENLRRHSSVKKKMVVGGLAGYGAAKLGQAMVKQEHDFDDTYSVKSGRPINQSRVSFQEEEQFQRYDHAGVKRPQSRQRAGRSKITSAQRGHRVSRSSSSSSSSSSHAISRRAALSAGVGAAGVAVGAAALGAATRRRSKSRSRSPSSRKKYFSKRVSPMHSYVDLSTANDGPGGLLSFFTSPSANSRKGKKPKGLFNFSNASSSSSDADLRFGEGTVRRKISKKRLRDRQGRQHRNNSMAAMEDLVNTGTALADEADWRDRKGRQKFDADRHKGPGRYADGRRVSLADHETSAGHDDEWYDTDGGGDSDISVDPAMAYGGAFSASPSREHLPQGGRASISGYNFREEDQRRYQSSLGQPNFGHTQSTPISAMETAAVAGAGGALGGWMASNALKEDSQPPPTYSSFDPMRELEPRPISDPPSMNTSAQATRVSSTTVPLQQPQPMVPIAQFIGHNISDGIQPEVQPRWAGERVSSNVTRDSNPINMPSRGPRSSVNFNLTDEQLENEERANGSDKRRMSSSGGNDRKKPAEALRDEASPRPRRPSDVGRSSFDTDKRVAEIDLELERLYQEHQKAEKRKRKESGLKKAVAGAVTAVAVDAIASKDNKSWSREEGTPTRKSSLKKTREKDASSSPETQQERIARIASQRIRSTPSPVQHDDYSAFFVPTELKEHLKEHNDKAEHRDDFGATVVEIIPGASKPASSHPFDPFTYRQFGLELDDDPFLHPWPVPILGLIEPTPPGSRGQSVKGDETPVLEPQSKEPSEDIGEPLERRESKVKWGDHDTYVYEVVTPEYERSDYGPDSHFQSQKIADIPTPDEITEEPIAINEGTQQRPSVSRAWTLDEKEAEKLEKEVPVVDDRPQISRAWTINDKEAEEITRELPEPQPKEDSPGETISHSTEDESRPQHATPSSMNGEPEGHPGDTFPAEADESNRKKAFYQSHFAETVSDLGVIGGGATAVQSEAKSRTVLALEDGDERSNKDLGEKETTPSAVRLSKSERRRRERSISTVDTTRPSPSHQVPAGLSEDVTPEQPSRSPDSERDLANKSDTPGSSALDLGLGTAAILTADQMLKLNAQHDDTGSASGDKDQSLRTEESTTFGGPMSQRPHSNSKGEYHSDPEEWERLREQSKRSKTGSKSDVGEKTPRKSKSRRSADSADFEPLRRSRTEDDLYENERSGRSQRHSNGDLDEKPTIGRNSKGEERASRGRHRKDSDGYHQSDNQSVTSSAPDSRTKKESSGFFSSLFSSNKSDVSSSSKKSSKSSKSEGRADRERYDGSDSRRKRRSKDKADFDDVASAVSEPSRRTQRSLDRQVVRIDQKETPHDQTVDDGFVSAEETAEATVKDIADQESFLASRPEMPQPMVTDMPMGTDGVSGPMSEREISSPPNTTSGNHSDTTTIPTEGQHIAATPTFLMEGDHSDTLPNEPAPGVVEEVQSPGEGSSAPFPQPAASRRLSAIRTGDIPSSPMAASSPTAVPLHFRRPPISPTNPRFSMSSPVMSPSSPLTTPRTRQGRPKSTEFRSSKEFRPLYLVERQNYAKTVASELTEEYPSLPSSKTSSAHPSMEDLRAEAHLQDQPESYSPSNINAEFFRERGRRHSYSYWRDSEKRRESPEYLDSRSATPVPGEAQRARDQEKKPKPKYEFHSPSELLQDPAFFHDVARMDEDILPQSPLPSVASTDADQDYMSARSRSLSPTPTRSRSRGRRSASTPRSTSAAWQDGNPTVAAGALVGSVLALAAHQALKGSEEDVLAEEPETPTNTRAFAEEARKAVPQSEPKEMNIPGARNETTSQEPTEHESVQAAIDLHDTESRTTTERALSTDAWRDVFAEIHKRQLKPDIVADASTAVNTKKPEIESLQNPTAIELGSPSNLEGVVPAQTVDGRSSDQRGAVEKSTTGPEEVGTLEKDSGESHEATPGALSRTAEPFHPVSSFEKQFKPSGGSQKGLGLQMDNLEEETIVPSEELGTLQDVGDKNDEDTRPTFDGALPPMAQGESEQSDAEAQNTGPKDVFALNRQDVEDNASGTDERFEDAADTQPTEDAPALKSETLAQPEVTRPVDIEKQNLAAGQAPPERSLGEDKSSDTAKSSRDPLEEAFKQAMEARGLTAGATVEAAYQAFQPEIPDLGGTQLSTIREEGEAPSPSAEQVLESTEREGLPGNSKKERRKQKKAKKASILDNLVQPDSSSAEAGQSLQLAIEERRDLQPVEQMLSGDTTKEPTPAGETPNPFGDDFEIKPSELDKPRGDVQAESHVLVAPGAASGIVPLPSTPDEDISVPKSKTSRKGKKEKKKQFQSHNWDDVDPTKPGEPAQAVELADQEQPSTMVPSDEPALSTSEAPGAPEISVGSTDTVQQESDHAPEMSSKMGKKRKSKKKGSTPLTIEETSGGTPEEPSTATMPSYESQPSTEQADQLTSQIREPTFTEQTVREPVAVEEPLAVPESFAPQSIDATSAVNSSVPFSVPGVVGDQAPQTPGAEETHHNSSLENKSDENQASDVHSAADSVGVEVPLVEQRLPGDHTQPSAAESENVGSHLAPTNTTTMVNPGTLTDETKQETRAVDTSLEPLPEMDLVQGEGATKHMEPVFEATSTVREGEQVHDEAGIAAPTPPALVEEVRTEEPLATSNYEEIPVTAQTPIDESSVNALAEREDEDIWAPATKRSRKDKKKKRISASNDTQQPQSVHKVPFLDETMTKPGFSDTHGDRDSEMPTTQGPTGALPLEDPGLVEDEPRQDEDLFPVTISKSKKDKKKKRGSAFEGSQTPSSVQMGDIIDSIANSEVPKDNSTTEAPTTHEFATDEPSLGREPQDVADDSSSKKKSKKSKVKKLRQYLLDDVAGSADDVGAGNEEQFPTMKETSTVPESSIDKLPHEATRSVETTRAEATVSDTSTDDVAATEASIIESTKTNIPIESRMVENPLEAAALVSPVEPTVQSTAEPTRGLADDLAPARTTERTPEPTTEAATDPTSGSLVEHPLEPTPEPVIEPVIEPAVEPAVELVAVPTAEPLVERMPGVAAEPTTGASTDTGVEAPVKTSAGSSRGGLNEANVRAPIEATLDTPTGLADEIGVDASGEAAVEPASSREVPAAHGDSEPVAEEDFSLSSKRSRKEKKNKKNKRQSTLAAEIVQPDPLPNENYAVADEPQPISDESTGTNITNILSPGAEGQGAEATAEDIDEENMASAYVVAKKDKKKKKRQSTQVADAPQSDTMIDSGDKSNIESETLAEARPIETVSVESQPASEPTTGSALETAQPDADAFTVEGYSENARQEQSETGWQEDLASLSKKSKKDKKKKKGQPKIESASPEPAFESPGEGASKSTADNVADHSTIDETRALETVEALGGENDHPTPGDQAEELWPSSDKKKKNRKKGQKLKLAEATLPQDTEQVSSQGDPYNESKIENVVREEDENLPEKPPMPEAAPQQKLTAAEAGDMVSDTLTSDTSTSIPPEGLGDQAEAADRAEESDKVLKDDKQDIFDDKKPLQDEPVPVASVQTEAELLNDGDRQVPEIAESLAGTPDEDATLVALAETAPADSAFEQAGLTRKKTRKGKKKARQSDAEGPEVQEAADTLIGEDSSAIAPEAEPPAAETEWPTPKKMKSKNGQRNNRQLELDAGGAEPPLITPEVEPANVEGLDEVTPQAASATPEALDAMLDQGPGIDDWNVTKKNGKKKKKRQSTLAEVEGLPGSVEASSRPTPITESGQPAREPSSSTVEGDAVSAPRTRDLTEGQRFDPVALETSSKSISDAGRPEETLTDALPAQERTIMEGKDLEQTTADDVTTTAPADIEESDSRKFQPSSHLVTDVPTTTVPQENGADGATVPPDSPAPYENRGTAVVTDGVEEAPTRTDTHSAHVEDLSTSVAPVFAESKQAHDTEANLPETLMPMPAAQSHLEESAGPDAGKPLGSENLYVQEDFPPESSTALPNAGSDAEMMFTSEVPSAVKEVNKGIEDATGEAVLSSRSKKKKNKKQRQSTYEEPVAEPQQTENFESEARAEEAETEPVVIDSPEQSPSASQMNDTVGREETIPSASNAKKDKKKKRKGISVDEEASKPQPTVQNDLKPVQDATASESLPGLEVVAKSNCPTSQEPDLETTEKFIEGLDVQRLTAVERIKDLSHEAATEPEEVIKASPPPADESGHAGEHLESSADGGTASHTENEPGIPEGTIQSIREDNPVVELDTVASGLSLVKKSKKEKRKSKRKSAIEQEEPAVDFVDGPRTETEVETPQDEVPAAPGKSSEITEAQTEAEWGFPSKKSKKKGKNSKVLTAPVDLGTPGTAPPNSNEEFASAMQTPIQRTASPELMDDVKATQILVPAPETGTADYFSPPTSKKKTKKDKKRNSFLAWTGNEDQTAEEASGASTPALLTETGTPKTGETFASTALAAAPEDNNPEGKPEISALRADLEVMKTEDTLESNAGVAEQEPPRSEDHINIAVGTRESMLPSAEPEITPDQYALNKARDPKSTPDQAASLSSNTEPRDDTMPREMEIDSVQPVSNKGDGALASLTDTARTISDSPEAKTGAEGDTDRVTPSLKEPGDSHIQDEDEGFVAAHCLVPEATDNQQGIVETGRMALEDLSTPAESKEADTMTTTTIAASNDTDSKRGLEEPDSGISKDTSKRKKSKKDKKAKRKSGISDGAENIETPKTELDQTQTREPGGFETVHEEGMGISNTTQQPLENAEVLSDVSSTTRERRKRRRSPPAWAGEEPEDLPRDRALTPPPEHDDIMDTALGVAAGLGFGAGEHESSRESSRKVPSPTRQPSAGWSFAKLDPVTKLTHADTNRDSGVQFESPTLSSGQSTSQRDSGYVPSPTVQHGEFSTTRDGNTDMNLRPPRPQSPTSSTEDVSKPVTGRRHVDQSASLETPRRKPSPVESTSKDRSSVLFNSSPAMPSPLNTDVRSRSPIASPLRRSPSIHGHHHSREELRQQKAKIAPHHEESDRLASNLIDRSAAAPVNRSTFDSHSQTNVSRPYSPGKTTLNAINEHVHEPTSHSHPFSGPPTSLTPRHSAENDSLATAGLVATAGAAAFAAATMASRDSPAPGAKSLGRTKSRTSSLRNLRSGSISPYDPANFASGSSQGPINAQNAGKAAVREREMAEVYDGYGSYPGSPRSPTRPPSIRQRQSMQQIRDLEAKLDQLASENRSLAEAKIVTEQQLEQAHFERNRNENATEAFNAQIQERDAEITRLKQEVASLIATHESLKKAHEQSLFSLRQNHEEAQSQWQDSLKELETLRSRHNELSTGMESIVRHEIDTALSEKNAEIQRLRGDLEEAREKIRDLQSQILSRGADDVVVFRDEDYFDQACQKLCQQVQGWVLRFSKFSDLKLCRTTSEVRDEKIVDRFDNAILDGSDVDAYLADRVKRRDVFMSVVMTMIWEYVFTRYLFGMDRDQRQKLKQLEKNLGEVGRQSAVHQWRALTLTLLSKRESFKAQRESDTEAVAIEIFSTLSRFLPPPQNLEDQIVGSLRNVMRTAVELSIEMRTQRAEYIMLPPLQPEYDTNGDLARKVYFNASLMNERSGETTSNEELEREHAVVRMVLFPLVVKKGDDNGVGDEEIVVCPAQVLIARPDKGKRLKSSTRHASGGSDAKSLRAVSTHSLAMSGIEGNENMF